MGSGRNKTPTRLKALKGTLQKCREIDNEVHLQELKAPPPVPSYFKGRAKKEWKIVTKTLFDLDMLYREDLPMLESYCYNVGLMEMAMRKLNDQGILGTYVNATGNKYIAKNKWISVYNEAVDRIVKLAAQFGFSPASRTHISMPTKAKNNEETQMFG